MDEKGQFDFNSTATRELKAKNPLGVSVSGSFEWENVDDTYPGRADKNNPQDTPTIGVDNLLNDHLVVFQKTQDGLNAAAWLLHDDYFQENSNTPYLLGNKWAGDKTGAYGNSIASIMGKAPNTILTFGIDGPAIMKALARMENGTAFVIGIPDEMYQTAVAYGSQD